MTDERLTIHPANRFGELHVEFEGKHAWLMSTKDAEGWKQHALDLQKRAALAAMQARRATAIAAELERREAAEAKLRAADRTEARHARRAAREAAKPNRRR